ncbi:hypothetical protein ACIHIX_34860 [Streptomyces sp. NPDC051913]|uniref:hypothetical protein n=1 Tax=Streptomyces sp. NPDC051913 TaxID=3365676 RepID=UPI0037D292D0
MGTLYVKVYEGNVPPKSLGGGVVVYAEPNMRGDYRRLAIGRYDTEALGALNDTISSMAVDQGFRVTLYEDAGFSGRSTVVTADTMALAADVDGTTSSLVVEEI